MPVAIGLLTVFWDLRAPDVQPHCCLIATPRESRCCLPPTLYSRPCLENTRDNHSHCASRFTSRTRSFWRPLDRGRAELLVV